MSSKNIILITGANSGIGYDTSYALAAASAKNHVIMGVRTLSKGEKAIKEITARSPAGTLSLLELDISKDTSIHAATQKVTADFGVIDVLVNNAGIVAQSSDRRTALRETFETNTFGTMVLTEALVPLLQKSKDPRIINVSSGLGSISLRTDTTDHSYRVPYEEYRMSKAALNMLSVCQFEKFEGWGAKVWAYCPGYVVTNLTGESDRQQRKDSGAESSETSAIGILEIVEGKRDQEVNKFLQRYGKQFNW